MVSREIIVEYTEKLKNVTNLPFIDLMAMLEHVTGKDKLFFLTHADCEIPPDQLEMFRKMADKRLTGMPLAYVLRRKEFMSLPFYVDERVLIPRPDTECIVEKIIASKREYACVLDIGTGSGCIAIALKKYMGHITMDAVDISKDALEVAQKNARDNEVDVRFMELDILNCEALPRQYDIIVSNPPYIRTGVMEHLSNNVRDFEPRTALDGGEDGLAHYRKILPLAKRSLARSGQLYLELGYDQYDALQKLALERGFTKIDAIYDLSKIKRGMICSL